MRATKAEQMRKWYAERDARIAREAEQRGYRRGVQDAVAAGDKMASEGTYGWVWLRAAILALLEPGEKK